MLGNWSNGTPPGKSTIISEMTSDTILLLHRTSPDGQKLVNDDWAQGGAVVADLEIGLATKEPTFSLVLPENLLRAQVKATEFVQTLHGLGHRNSGRTAMEVCKSAIIAAIIR